MMMEPEPRRRTANETHQEGSETIAEAARPSILEIKEELKRHFEILETQSFPRELQVGPSIIQTADIASDVHDFNIQKEVFDARGIPHLAVTMENRIEDTEYRLENLFESQNVNVLIKVPDLGRPEESYSFFVSDLERSGLEISHVDSSEAEDVFLSRLSEFVSSRANFGQAVTPPVTIVHSNRRGDTVLYARGYFLSTGTAFGVSTPATGTLAGGRYSFGILNSGSPKFENIVWSISATKKIKLNLP